MGAARQTELIRLESPTKALAKRPLLQTELAQRQQKLLHLAKKKLSILAKQVKSPRERIPGCLSVEGCEIVAGRALCG